MNERDEELLQRYREASDTEPAAPAEHVRAAILAEGLAAAGRYAASQSHAHRGTRRRWMYTLIGTASAAVLAGILVLPGFLKRGPAETPGATMSAPRAAAPAELARRKEVELEPAPAPAAAPALTPAPARTLAPAASLEAAPQTPPTLPVAAAPAAKKSAEQAPEAMSADASVAAGLARRSEARSELQAIRAVTGNDLEGLKQALQAGAAVDERDRQGRTPLLLAVELGNMELAKELLDHGANPAATDAAGRTPLALARQLRRTDLVDLLERAGARR